MSRPPMHPVVAEVTARIVARSAVSRRGYLARIAAAADQGPARGKLGCANIAHGFAAAFGLVAGEGAGTGGGI